MTFEPSPEGGEGVSQVDNKGRAFEGGVSGWLHGKGLCIYFKNFYHK